MKFIVQFKDPDALHDCIADAVQNDVANLSLSEDEREAVEEKRREKVSALCARWFEYSEYVRIEIDTDAKTATVLPVS